MPTPDRAAENNRIRARIEKILDDQYCWSISGPTERMWQEMTKLVSSESDRKYTAGYKDAVMAVITQAKCMEANHFTKKEIIQNFRSLQKDFK